MNVGSREMEAQLAKEKFAHIPAIRSSVTGKVISGVDSLFSFELAAHPETGWTAANINKAIRQPSKY